MKKKIKKILPYLLIVSILLSVFFSITFENLFFDLRNFFYKEFFFVSSLSYFLVVVISIIFFPITIIPVIPFVSKILGATETFFLTFLGVFIGSYISFFLARKIGKEFIFKIFSENEIKKLEIKIPKNLKFWNILFFRFFTSPASFSYFLALYSKIKTIDYLKATILGIIPLTFILSYSADALTHNNKFLSSFLIFSLLIIIFSKLFFEFLNFKKVKLITHSFNFHTDDVFACATLALFLEKKGVAYKIIRTRDEKKLIKYKAEARKKRESVFVFDVGEEYDEENNLFDHHQKEGVTFRENGISFSSFGLVWKKYGEKLCSSREISEKIDYNLVMGIDANDTGVNLNKPLYDFSLYNFVSLTGSFYPISGEEKDFNIAFLKVVSIAKLILENEIKWARKKIGDEKKFEILFNKAKDKRVIWIDQKINVGKFFINHPEILFLVKKKENNIWVIISTFRSNKSNEFKMKMPKKWGGLSGEKLEKVSGIKGIKFCHINRWICVVNSRGVAKKVMEKILE